MKWPKISLIVPVFNEEDILNSYLKHALEEIKYPNYEVLLGIDGEDNSINIARKWAKKYKNIYISYSKERRGIFAAENILLKKAKGKIIVKLDPDIRFIEPDKALFNIAGHYENPKIGALWFDSRYTVSKEKKRSLTVRGEIFIMKLVADYMESVDTVKGRWNCFLVVNSIRNNILNELELNSLIDDIQFAFATLDKHYEIKFVTDVKICKIGNPPNPKELFNQKKRNYKYWLRSKEKNKEIRIYLFYWIVFKYFLNNIRKYNVKEIISFFYWCTIFAFTIINTNISSMIKNIFKERSTHIEWQKIRRVEKK
jgi:glycosyltransferase involved in cell wall biosynthesis